jgi:hypothetical protein
MRFVIAEALNAAAAEHRRLRPPAQGPGSERQRVHRRDRRRRGRREHDALMAEGRSSSAIADQLVVTRGTAG